ncbi:MAG: formimidoylglutamate deiminase [Pseudomonadota bacterium]|nr:formimidoylglutamate deiminase [Pseudomonadota bacterium]
MAAFKFDYLYSKSGWLSPGFVLINSEGWITYISEVAPPEKVMHIPGIAMPGMTNVHSHAFQRGMAGLSEYRTAATHDSFWTWRELMYQFVSRLSPDDFEAIAAQLYIEMLKSGYTAVGEFQYLHHNTDGTPFDVPAEMSLRALAAARETGIGLTLLPVFYRYAGFAKQPPTRHQERFVNDPEEFLKIYRSLSEATGCDPNCNTGIAPHSLRAVDVESIREVMGEASVDTPVHIHIAEQKKEVDDCVAFFGRRPYEHLQGSIDFQGSWCLIHGTHLTAAEVNAAIASGMIAGLCPTTEANLGDGLFDLPEWQRNNGAFGIGSDSHISISPVEELRWLEYGQRLRDRRRNVAATGVSSTGKALFDSVVAGGAAALSRTGGNGETGLELGARGDIIVLDMEAPIFAGHTPDTFLDAWVFSGNEPLVTDVFVGGSPVITEGRHEHQDEAAFRYQAAVNRLLA